MRNGLLLGLSVLLPGVSGSYGPSLGSPPQPVVAGYDTLRMRFEPNVGQLPASVQYVARGAGYGVALTESGPILKSGKKATPALRVGLIGARAHPALRPEQPQSSVSNYLIGNDPTQWHRHVPNYAAVRYEQVYPGIDWVVYGNPHQLEYDFVVAPHADVSQIGVSVVGVDGITVDGGGDLTIKAGGATWRQLKPLVYQADRDGVRHSVDAHYRVERGRFAFAVGAYDHSRPLIIDPELVYSTYLGGSNGSGGAGAAAVDSAGDLYVAGSTTSMSFPLASAVQSADEEAQSSTAFISKFDPSGNALLYSTYLGGHGTTVGAEWGDVATAIAVDNAGNAYVTGYTSSIDFPLVNPYQASNAAAASAAAGATAFVTKLDSTGSTLLYSTYLGGSIGPYTCFPLSAGWGIAVDDSGSAYVVGQTDSDDFPTVNAFQATAEPQVTNAGGAPVVSPGVPCHTPSTPVLSKLSPAGNALVYSTYLGPASAVGAAKGVAVDSSGSAYVVGVTEGGGFPTVAAFQAVPVAGYTGPNGFVTKFSPSGTTLMYSTYLGGSSQSWPAAVAVDAAGEAYATGITGSTDFPVVNPLQAHNNSTLPATRGVATTAFVTKFNAAGSGLIFSTYLGGSGIDSATSIALDSDANAYVGGSSYSNDFPTVNPLQNSNNGYAHGVSNAFVAVINSTGTALEFSTYLGGSGYCPSAGGCTDGDTATGIAVDPARNIYVAGSASSADFPLMAPFQSSKPANAPFAAFATRISGALPAVTGPMAGGGGHGGGGEIGWDLIGLCAAFATIRGRRRCLSPGRNSAVT
jgi:hypothetical protein